MDFTDLFDWNAWLSALRGEHIDGSYARRNLYAMTLYHYPESVPFVREDPARASTLERLRREHAPEKVLRAYHQLMEMMRNEVPEGYIDDIIERWGKHTFEVFSQALSKPASSRERSDIIYTIESWRLFDDARIWSHGVAIAGQEYPGPNVVFPDFEKKQKHVGAPAKIIPFKKRVNT